MPLSAAEFFAAEDAARDEDGEPDPRLKPLSQIMCKGIEIVGGR